MQNTVTLSPEELQTRTLSAENRALALSSLTNDGFVVLANAVNPEHLRFLQERMLDDIPSILARDDAPFNWVTGNLQQEAPPFEPYLFRDILVNDFVVALTKAALGPGQFCDFYSGNTAMPSEQRQPVHFDFGPLWPGQRADHPAHGLIVNIPVVDMSPENGAIELWPRSHTVEIPLSLSGITLTEELLDRQRESSPPFQPTVALGGVLIRDVRLWHAGMPNKTQQPRPMLALIHWTAWYHSTARVTLPTGAAPYIAHPDLDFRATFTDAPIDHLQHGTAYDFKK